MRDYSSLPYATPTANREVFNIRDEATPGQDDGTPIVADMVAETLTTWVRIIQDHLGELLSGDPENSNPIGTGDSQIYRGLEKMILDVSQSGVGQIAPFGTSSSPMGFLLCDGSAISRTLYANLFSAIGTIWGSGDGSTTFNLPDLRGVFLRGSGLHGSLLTANGSQATGQGVGVYQDDMMQGHTHYGFDANGFNWGVYGESQVDIREQPVGNPVSDPGDDGYNGMPRVGAETRPFSAGVNFYIRY